MDYQIANKVAGENRKPGLGKINYAELSTFDNLATVFASPSNQAEKVTIDGAHTFNNPVTEGFFELYATDTLRMLETEVVGERDSKGKKVTVSGFFPGTSEEFEAFLLDDPDLILLCEPFPCNGTKIIQVGTACSPARIVEDSYKTGTNAEGKKGYEFKIEAFQSSLLFYTGPIPRPTG